MEWRLWELHHTEAPWVWNSCHEPILGVVSLFLSFPSVPSNKPGDPKGLWRAQQVRRCQPDINIQGKWKRVALSSWSQWQPRHSEMHHNLVWHGKRSTRKRRRWIVLLLSLQSWTYYWRDNRICRRFITSPVWLPSSAKDSGALHRSSERQDSWQHNCLPKVFIGRSIW